jgi:hypothetical protein
MSTNSRRTHRHGRTCPAEIAHALNNVLATIVLAVGVLRRGSHSPADQAVLDLLEHAAREAEELGSSVASFGVRTSAALFLSNESVEPRPSALAREELLSAVQIFLLSNTDASFGMDTDPGQSPDPDQENCREMSAVAS